MRNTSLRLPLIFIGVEIEFPVVNLAKKPVDFGVVHDLTRRFKTEFGFYTAVIDSDREICSLVRFDNDDILSYDCSYNNLELSFGKEVFIFVLWDICRWKERVGTKMNVPVLSPY
jgi:hypothetical protein